MLQDIYNFSMTFGVMNSRAPIQLLKGFSQNASVHDNVTVGFTPRFCMQSA